jgi:hypothetical protein
MAIWAEDSQILWSTVSEVSVDVLNLDRNVSAGWINFTPPTARTFLSISPVKVNPYLLTQSPGGCQSRFFPEEPSLYVLFFLVQTMTDFAAKKSIISFSSAPFADS